VSIPRFCNWFFHFAYEQLFFDFYAFRMLCRSSKTADLIKDEIGSLLKVPNSTRWNPVFDAVARLVQMFETRNKLNGLNRVCNTFKVPPFTSGIFTLKQIFLKSPSECYKI